jgi:tetratricopeptide (TPR) repeat protein
MKEPPHVPAATEITERELSDSLNSIDDILKKFVAVSGRSDEQVNPREMEHSFKRMALALFIRAFETERIESTRYGSAGIMYIIGELLRQFGDYKQAVKWFARAVKDEKRHPQIERLARDQWELAREMYREEIQK